MLCCSAILFPSESKRATSYYSCSWLDTSWVLPFLPKLHLKLLRERDTCQSEENLFPVLVGEEDHLYINGDNKKVIRRRMSMIEQIQNGSSWKTLVLISLFRQLRRPSVSFKIQKGLSNSVAKKLDLFIALFFAFGN